MADVLRIAFVLLAVVCAPAFGADVALSINPGKTLNRVDEKVYGHFLEHIYHSVNGGLWGEMVWNRNFEENTGGIWRREGDTLVQDALSLNVRTVFGNPQWTDYEYSLEAMKTGGSEGFIIIFRHKSPREFYWANLGGWRNNGYGIERGRATGGWRLVGRQVKGRIETGRWYAIRIRCEGPHIQAWLDGEKVLDVVDDDGAHLSGAVGVGTWETKARFRKLRVATLDGKELPLAISEETDMPATGRHWTTYGDGSAALSSREPLNGSFCQKLVGKEGETGIQQDNLRVRKGEDYSGSVWARGGGAGTLVVRFVDGEDVLAEAELGAPKEDWAEHKFAFRPKVAADRDARIQVGVKGRGTVWVGLVSMMSSASEKAGGFRPDLLQAVADLRPPIIRWPGGCFAEWYRWKDGVGPQHLRQPYPIEIWDDKDVNSFGTDEFIRLCRKVGAEPLIVVNIGSHESPEKRAEYVREACEWIEYCNGSADTPLGRLRAKNGHPEPYGVRFWEIDNETWFMGAERYAAAVLEFAKAMRQADPSIKLAACGSNGMGPDALAWNRVIIERCADVIDYLSIHHYESPDLFEAGPRNYEAFFRRTAELINKSKNPALKLYVSEWNAQSTDWRTGLYAGGLLNAFERCGNIVEMAGPALFLRHKSANDWDNAFINFDHTGWFPAPNYVVMELWRDHFAPLRIEVVGEARPLDGVATKSADGQTLYYKVLNPANEPVSVELTVSDDFPLERASMQTVSPGALNARNRLGDPDRVRTVSAKVDVEGQRVRFNLPAWAAAAVTMSRKNR